MAVVAEQPNNSIPLLQPISPPKNDVVSHTSCRRWLRKFLITTAATLSLLLLASLTTYAFWPSDPTLTIIRLRLTKVKICTFSILNIYIKMNVMVEVQNADVYAAELRKMDVEVMHKGKTIRVVRSVKGSVIRAYATSYLEAEMNLKGIGVIADGLLLIRDLKTGEVLFGTVVEIAGKFGFLYFRFPLKARMSCEVMLKTREGKVEGGGRCGRRRIGLGFEIGWVFELGV